MTGVGQVLFAFFEDYLKAQKGLRPGSVRSYRDTMKHFLAYVASSCRRPITRLQLADLSAQRVRAFLNEMEPLLPRLSVADNHRSKMGSSCSTDTVLDAIPIDQTKLRLLPISPITSLETRNRRFCRPERLFVTESAPCPLLADD
jgi:hypothetical protein